MNYILTISRDIEVDEQIGEHCWVKVPSQVTYKKKVYTVEDINKFIERYHISNQDRVIVDWHKF